MVSPTLALRQQPAQSPPLLVGGWEVRGPDQQRV